MVQKPPRLAPGFQGQYRDSQWRLPRISFDTTTGTLPPGSLALKIERDTFSNYWIGVRRKFTDIADMQSGAYVIWGHNTGVDSDLLDVSTPGSNTWDAALGLNQTLTDTLNGISIKSVASTATYEDVQVTFSGTFAPVITSPATADGLVGVPFNYQITARGGATSFGVSGTLPPGLSLNAVTGIISGAPRSTGNYAVTVRASNAGGTGTRPVNFAIVSSQSLGNAVESPTLSWSSQGTTVWKPEFSTSYDGSDGVQSGAIPDDGTSTLATTVTGPATVIFRWKVESEDGYDYLKFRTEGGGTSSEASISGQWSWTKRTFTLGMKNTNYKLSWTYTKDGGFGYGRDAGWVDGVVVYGPGYPVSTPDFDVDGRTDLLLYSASTRKTAEWFLRDSARLASSAWGPIVPAGYEIKGSADFNGDGETNLVLYRASTRQTAIWLLKEGTFVKGIWGPIIPAGWQIAAAADMNRDNKPDLVLYRAATYQTAIWLMNGASYSSSFYGPPLVNGYQLAGVADFNRDKYPDFVLYRSSDRRAAIWYLDNSGSRRTSSAWGPSIPVGYRLEGISDFDRSGRPDFLLYSSSTRRTAIWYLNNTSVLRTVFGPVSASGYVPLAP